MARGTSSYSSLDYIVVTQSYSSDDHIITGLHYKLYLVLHRYLRRTSLHLTDFGESIVVGSSDSTGEHGLFLLDARQLLRRLSSAGIDPEDVRQYNTF